jgi:hypothetical protein
MPAGQLALMFKVSFRCGAYLEGRIAPNMPREFKILTAG